MLTIFHSWSLLYTIQISKIFISENGAVRKMKLLAVLTMLWKKVIQVRDPRNAMFFRIRNFRFRGILSTENTWNWNWLQVSKQQMKTGIHWIIGEITQPLFYLMAADQKIQWFPQTFWTWLASLSMTWKQADTRRNSFWIAKETGKAVPWSVVPWHLIQYVLHYWSSFRKCQRHYQFQ